MQQLCQTPLNLITGICHASSQSQPFARSKHSMAEGCPQAASCRQQVGSLDSLFPRPGQCSGRKQQPACQQSSCLQRVQCMPGAMCNTTAIVS